MTTVIFTDNTDLKILTVNATNQFVQNVNRDVLEFVVPAEGNSIDALSAIFFKEGNTRQLTLKVPVKDGEVELENLFIYKDYVIPTLNPISLVKELVTPETSDSPAVYRSVIKVQLAQETYGEKIIRNNTIAIEQMRIDNAQSNTELFEMLMLASMGRK